MGRWTFDTLTKASDRELREVFAQGTRPRFADLAGYEFRGFNPPAFAKLLGFQRFIKGFYQKAGEPAADQVDRIYGYNLFCDRKAPADQWIALPNPNTPRRHGFYDVYVPKGKLARFDNAVLIDYGVPENHNFNPERLIRDYLVQVDPDNHDLFLGNAFLHIGPLKINSNFFILGRLHQHHYHP
jgi:hypothetical protein